MGIILPHRPAIPLPNLRSIQVQTTTLRLDNRLCLVASCGLLPVMGEMETGYQGQVR